MKALQGRDAVRCGEAGCSSKSLVIEKITLSDQLDQPRKKPHGNQKKNPKEDWDGDDGSVRKTSAPSARGPKFDPQKPREKGKEKEKAGTVAHMWDPSARETGMG